MKFSDIKQFPFASYHVHMSWNYLREWLASNNEGIMKLDMDPPYQRGYVWTVQQKIAYIEYQLQGGFSGRDIFWNCPTWMKFHSSINTIQLVDGKQRVQAVLDFLDNKVKAFGLYYREFEDKISPLTPHFIFHVNNLQSPLEVVEWYIGMNTGGSIHTEEDLKPARDYYKRLLKIGKRK